MHAYRLARDTHFNLSPDICMLLGPNILEYILPLLVILVQCHTYFRKHIHMFLKRTNFTFLEKISRGKFCTKNFGTSRYIYSIWRYYFF